MSISSRAGGARTVWGALLAALALVLGAGVVSPADADGGSYPSQAPTLTANQTVTGGVAQADIYCGFGETYNCAGDPGVQYYRLALGLGDQVTFDFQALAGSGTVVCVMSPSVTDYTVADADCLAYGETAASKFGELKFTAGQSASYLIAVTGTGYRESWGYSLIAKLRTRTTPTITLKAPKKAHVGQTIKLRGTIVPGITKKLQLESKSPAHGWQSAGSTKADPDGHFTFGYHLGHSGPHEFRVEFAGKGLYDPASSRTVHVKVGG